MEDVNGNPLSNRIRGGGKGESLLGCVRIMLYKVLVRGEGTAESVFRCDLADERLSLSHLTDKEARRCHTHRQSGEDRNSLPLVSANRRHLGAASRTRLTLKSFLRALCNIR